MKQLLIRMKNKFTDNRNEMIRTLLLSEGFGFCFSLSCICGYRLDKYDTVCAGPGQIVSGLVLALVFGAVIAVLMTALGCLIDEKKENAVAEEVVEPTSAGTVKQNGMASSERLGIRWLNSDASSERFGITWLNSNATSDRFKLAWLLSAAVIMLCWLPVLLAYFPAVFSYDGEAQLYQVISQNYSTHHPLIHTLLMGICMKIGFSDTGINNGMTLYAVIQMILMAAMTGWSIAEMIRLRTKRVWIVLYALFVCLFPVHAILSISTTKDVLFAGFMLVFTLLLRRIVVAQKSTKSAENDKNENSENELKENSEHELKENSEHEQKEIANYVKLALITVTMLLFRNNAVYAMAAMLVILAIVLLVKRKEVAGLGKIVITLIVALAVSTIISAGLKAGLKAESGSPREALAIPIQQMARVKALHGNSIEEPLKSDLEQLIATEWADRYDEHLADPIKERISMKQPALFVKTWIKLGLKYPGDYIDAWLLTTEGAWYIRDKSCNRIYGEGRITGFGYLSTDIRNMPEGFEVRDASLLPGLKGFLEGIVSDNAFENIPILRLIFAPALYVWTLFLYMHSLIVRRKYSGLVVILFMIMYFLTLMLSPAILVRYMYPYMLLVFLPALKWE